MTDKTSAQSRDVRVIEYPSNSSIALLWYYPHLHTDVDECALWSHGDDVLIDVSCCQSSLAFCPHLWSPCILRVLAFTVSLLLGLRNVERRFWDLHAPAFHYLLSLRDNRQSRFHFRLSILRQWFHLVSQNPRGSSEFCKVVIMIMLKHKPNGSIIDWDFNYRFQLLQHGLDYSLKTRLRLTISAVGLSNRLKRQQW